MATSTHLIDDGSANAAFPKGPLGTEASFLPAPAAPLLEPVPAPIREPVVAGGVDELSNAELADVLALVLEQFCRAGSARGTAGGLLPAATDPAALFFSPSRQTSFTLSFYCRRLLEYTCCSKSCFVVAVLYLARLAGRCPVFELSELNVHRLVCTAVVLAAKWLDDVSYSNAHYARVAGVHTAAEMSRMEAHMLKCLDFRLHVDEECFREVESNLLHIAANWL